MRQRRIEAYNRALANGEMDVAYSRVFFLGTAGVGMKSFKRSLMKLPWEHDTSADSNQLRPFTHEWHTLKDDQLKAASLEDEIEELTGLIYAVYKKNLDDHDKKFQPPPDDDVIKDALAILNAVISFIENNSLKKIKPRPFLHFWDSGGQPPFLEILPVFLTSRTLFFLIFDAEKDLNIKSMDQEEVHMTTLDYMLSWMANIHGHLLSYDDEGGFCEFPRMYCVGTHGDRVVKEKKSEIEKELEHHCQGKNFRVLLEDTVIVDNTTSGQGENEDPSLQALRKAVVQFTEEKLVLKTPLSWVLFRKVIQVISKKCNVISLKYATIIGVSSQIPPEDVPHALMFYHELGVLLFYPQIVGMEDKVVINPKYIVDGLGELFISSVNPDRGRYHKEWELFHESGILVQPLYVALWKKYGEVSPDIFIKVLAHFHIAVEVKTDEYFPPSKQYFMPLALKSTQVKSPITNSQAAPLHITFSSGFVPPGFFTRFVVALANAGRIELCFEKGVYRNCVTFRYQDRNSNSIEHIIVTDCRDVVQINVQHHSCDQELVSFPKICQDIRVYLENAAVKVKKLLKDCASGWTDDIKPTRYIFTHKFKYVCTSCSTITTSPHYIKLPPSNTTQDSQVFCDKNKVVYRALTEQEKVWFKDTSQSTPATQTSPTATSKSPERNDLTKERVLKSSDVSDVRLLDITDLDDVVDELRSIDFTEWKALGLSLGLYHNNLGIIEESCRGNVKKCFTECMAAWLKGEDKVREKGGPSWSSLATALEKIEANGIANNINAKYNLNRP
ncbi:PREDICTED: uncharacterized protein LOC105314442 [Amphimedon queenslandica]|uniref:COR domain-containing protein n=2 Tax=Amphimedon queenslandica TaxID=400682 RepID=A0AAN0JLV3_AMPQE|nr:PREDICTED: uncharacterized protein LOC105314442 [Amphimedon queenslandica]|eukprot:XP_019857981.1 PREDICTED: uncharacterized protein LOC105314442 [Amphimedon queenslandica]